MQIEKAIEILEAHRTGRATTPAKDHIDALTLGIEALKWMTEARKHIFLDPDDLLPGETKD